MGVSSPASVPATRPRPASQAAEPPASIEREQPHAPYTTKMPLDIAAVQAALTADGLDGWLLYDFHGSNPIASRLAGVSRQARHMTTRRWYYLIPAQGDAARARARHRDATTSTHLPGAKIVLRRPRCSSTRGLDTLLAGVRRVAMEYSPGARHPVRLARRCRHRRGDPRARRRDRVVGRSRPAVRGVLDRRGRLRRIATPPTRSTASRIARSTPSAQRLRDGTPTTEYDIQQLMAAGSATKGWSATRPRWSPSAPTPAIRTICRRRPASQPIGTDEIVLLDLWGKLPKPGAVFADITWVGFTGRSARAAGARVRARLPRARDAAIALVQESAARRARPARLGSGPRRARRCCRMRATATQILHRTGHSLGETVHGNGVHMDDYETHDDRRLLPGTGFTIEPASTSTTFGVRTEINMVVRRARRRDVTGPVQPQIVALVVTRCSA